VQQLREREQDVQDAAQAVRQASEGIQKACEIDRERLADAMDRGELSTTTAEDEARRELAEAERLLAAHQLRAERARTALDEVLDASIDSWTDTLVRAIQKSESDCLRRVDALEQADHLRGEQRVALSWLRRRAAGQKLPSLYVGPTPSSLPRNANSPERHSIPALLDHIRQGLAEQTLAAQDERELAVGRRSR
jgi:hypothetical protein